MGSATTQALAAATASLETQQVTLDTARELFAAARALSGTTQLVGAIADPAAPVAAREKVVSDVFGSVLGAASVAVLRSVAAQRWSSPADLIDGVEDLAIRTAAKSADTDIEAELFEVTRLVAANPELELALGSRLGDSAAKGGLVESLLASRANAATTLIVSSLVQDPRERRVRQLLSRAMQIAASQRGRIVATATSAVALSPAHRERLEGALAKKYGAQVSLNVVVDPAVVGGLRVQIADDVIDGSVSSRLVELRQRLAG